MTSSPLVTICVPTIGRADFLASTWASIEGQSLQDFEVVVLDNASPQPEAEQWRTWARRFGRATVLRIDPRVPMFRNFNRGFEAAKGRYVTFFHDDDVYRPTFLESLIGLMERNPQTALGGSNFDFIDENGRVIETRRWVDSTSIWAGRSYIDRLMKYGRNPIPMPGIIYRRDAIREFDESLSIHFGDFVILMRLAEQRDLAMHAEPLVQIRKHLNQASRTQGVLEGILERADMLSAYCNELERRQCFEASFIRRLRKHNERSKVRGLFWAWLNEEPTQADAALKHLGPGMRLLPLKAVLRGASSIGMTPRLRRTMVPAFRRLAAALRM